MKQCTVCGSQRWDHVCGGTPTLQPFAFDPHGGCAQREGELTAKVQALELQLSEATKQNEEFWKRRVEDAACLLKAQKQLEDYVGRYSAMVNHEIDLNNKIESIRQEAYDRGLTVVELEGKLATANRLIEAFQKECDCGDKNCCLRDRQGRRGIVKAPECLCNSFLGPKECKVHNPEKRNHEGACTCPPNCPDPCTCGCKAKAK